MASNDLRVRLRRLLHRQQHTDCTFHIEHTVVHSHRIILAIASPVFEAMLYGPLAETGPIRIADVGAAAFQLMLEYIYTDQLDATDAIEAIDEHIELYYCADKYLLTELLHASTQLIRKSLRHTNILRAIDGAVTLHCVRLADMCAAFFAEYCQVGRFFARVLAHGDYHMSGEALSFLLSRSDGQRQQMNLVCLVRRWCRTEAMQQHQRRRWSDDGDGDDLARAAAELRVLQAVRMPTAIAAAVHSSWEADAAAEPSSHRRGMGGALAVLCQTNAWIWCQRQQFRAVRPLRQTADAGGQLAAMRFETTLQTGRFVAVRTLCINSRLAPTVRRPQLSDATGGDYTEQVRVTVRALGDEGEGDTTVVAAQTFVVFDAEYNSTVALRFEQPWLCAADVCYAVLMEWPAGGGGLVGREYPMSVMAPRETVLAAGGGSPRADVEADGCELQFDGRMSGGGAMMCGQGSLLVGLEFVVLS